MAMPTPADFQRPQTGVPSLALGGATYTDWNAYNSAATRWRQEQEEGRYSEGRKLLQDVMAMFQDNGAYDQSYRDAKNKFMAKSTSDMVLRGMGNLVNTPALDLGYEKEVRPEFEMGKQSRLAAAMSAMANYIGSYNPSSEQMAQPMSVNRVSGGSAFGNPFASGPGSSQSVGSQSTSMSAGMGMPGDPIGQRLANLNTGGSNNSQSPFAGMVMMGSDPDWRTANSPGLVTAGNRATDSMFANDQYLKFGPRA